MPKGNFIQGALFFWRGIIMIFSPEVRRYIIFPVLINIVLFVSIFGGLGWALMHYFTSWMADYPRWLMYLLGWLFWILYLALSLLIGAFTFTLSSNLIASPFYGILAEITEKKLNGATNNVPFSILKIVTREGLKIFYFLPWLLIGALLFIFPPLWPLLPFILFFPLAWFVAIQYIDYCPDNQGIPFKTTLLKLKEQSLTVLGFGCVVSFALGIPLANLFVPPAAVVGGCMLWLHIQKRPSE